MKLLTLLMFCLILTLNLRQVESACLGSPGGYKSTLTKEVYSKYILCSIAESKIQKETRKERKKKRQEKAEARKKRPSNEF